ncbi:MAG: nitrilase-related carbon-nitrogen hydrolase [bacterium]
MRVGFLQYQVRFGEAAANRASIESLLGDAKFDLLVLPELCLSGYFMPSGERLRELATPFGEGETFEFFRKLARDRDGALVFGFPELDGGAIFNSAAAVLPDGTSHNYRKVHLFDREKEWYDQADTGFSVFEFRGAKIGMMICFDWIFPEAARVLALMGADIIAHPSNLVLHLCQDAMVTRAIENSVFTVTCNRTGSDRAGEEEIAFTGKSRIVSPDGQVLGEAGAADEKLSLIDIDLSQARDKLLTPNNDLLADRRPEFYGSISKDR